MKEQNFDDLQKECRLFLEYMYVAYNILEDLADLTNTFLLKHIKLKNYDMKFLESVELNLLYFEKLLANYNDIMETVDNITLTELNLPKSENIINMSDYVIIPENYEKDIYVDNNDKFDW